LFPNTALTDSLKTFSSRQPYFKPLPNPPWRSSAYTSTTNLKFPRRE